MALKHRFFAATTIVALLAAPAAKAQLVNENLLVGAPKGYKLGFSNKSADAMIAEWVPDGQTVENWTEMVTHQIFYRTNVSPQQFMARIDASWTKACPGARPGSVITQDTENGYPMLIWLQACPLNPKTNKPEITWFKAIRGNDSFYVVQKASKFMPPQDQVTVWIKYLQSASVCDSRLPDRACPK